MTAPLPITKLLRKFLSTGQKLENPSDSILEKVQAIEEAQHETARASAAALVTLNKRRKWDRERQRRRRTLPPYESTGQRGGVESLSNRSKNLSVKKDSSKKDSSSNPVDGEQPAFVLSGGKGGRPNDWPIDFRFIFWAICPRKVEKKAAMAKLDAIRKSGLVPWATFFAGLNRWAEESAGKEPRYVKHPPTWLNRGCWDDEPMPPDGGVPGRDTINKGSAFDDIAMGARRING